MRIISTVILIFCWISELQAQSSFTNQSDGNTPLIPAPLTIPAHISKCSDNLLVFVLPCASSKQVVVKNLARLKFSGSCRHEVVFEPAILNVPKNESIRNYKVEAIFDGVRIPATITMVNSDLIKEDKIMTANLSSGITTLIQFWRNKILQNGLANSLNGALTTCAISGNKIPKVNSSAGVRNVVCEGSQNACVSLAADVNVRAAWGNTISCEFPVFGIPYVSSLTASVTGNLDGVMNISGQSDCNGSSVCKPVNLMATIKGGISGKISGSDVIADLHVIADGVSVQGDVCLLPLPVSGCARVKLGKLRIVGNIQSLWGLTTNKVDYTIYDGYTSPSFCVQ